MRFQSVILILLSSYLSVMSEAPPSYGQVDVEHRQMLDRDTKFPTKHGKCATGSMNARPCAAAGVIQNDDDRLDTTPGEMKTAVSSLLEYDSSTDTIEKHLPLDFLLEVANQASLDDAPIYRRLNHTTTLLSVPGSIPSKETSIKSSDIYSYLPVTPPGPTDRAEMPRPDVIDGDDDKPAQDPSKMVDLDTSKDTTNKEDGTESRPINQNRVAREYIRKIQDYWESYRKHDSSLQGVVDNSNNELVQTSPEHNGEQTGAVYIEPKPPVVIPTEPITKGTPIIQHHTVTHFETLVVTKSSIVLQTEMVTKVATVTRIAEIPAFRNAKYQTVLAIGLTSSVPMNASQPANSMDAHDMTLSLIKAPNSTSSVRQKLIRSSMILLITCIGFVGVL